MIELIVKDYLKTKLDVPVRMEIPANPPDTFVVLEKTGSTRENRLDTATFAIQSYATSMAEAASLNEEVKSAMEEMIELNAISSVHLNSDYNFTDTSEHKYRYQCLYVVTYLRL